MKVAITDGRLINFKCLNDDFHSFIFSKLLNDGEVFIKRANGVVFGVDDQSFSGQLLKAIDKLIDGKGADALETLNNLNWQAIHSMKAFYQSPIQKAKDPSKYAENLIDFRSGTFAEVEEDKTEVLFSSHDFDEVYYFAIDHLEKKLNFAKRVKIIYCTDSRSNVVCVRR